MAGILNIKRDTNDLIGKVYINWTAGNTQGREGLSVASVSIRFDIDAIVVKENHIHKEWGSAYTLLLGGYFIIKIGQEERAYYINGSFIIPELYHETHH